MKHSIKLDRRDFIKGLAAVGLLSTAQVNKALAATTVAPIRVLFVALQHGWGLSQKSNRSMQLSGDAFTFPDGLDPLNAIRDKITVVNGVRTLGEWGNNHDLSYADMLTAGVPFGMKSSSYDKHMPLSQNASLDYLLEQHSGLPTFRFSAGYRSWGVEYHPLSFDHDINILPFHTSAKKAYDSIFKGLPAPSSKALNFVQSPAEQSLDALPEGERSKLERYLVAMQHLESKNQVTSSFSGSETLSSIPSGAETRRQDIAYFMDMVKVGFANNMTTSAVLGIGDIHSITDFHHSHAHACSDTWWNTRREFAQHVVNLTNALDTVADFDGNSLLDNTLVVLTGEVGDGKHDINNKGHIIIGGESVLNTGKHIAPEVLASNAAKKTKREDQNGSLRQQVNWGNPCSSRTNADLLREIGNLAGLSLDEFGLPSQNTGDILAS